MLKKLCTAALTMIVCQAMEQSQSCKSPESLKNIVAEIVCKKLYNTHAERRPEILRKIPADVKVFLCNRLKEYKFDELQRNALRIVCEHGKKSVLNYSNTIFAGISPVSDDKILLSEPDKESQISCPLLHGFPIRSIAWHPTKNILAVAQKGIWFLNLAQTHIRYCAKPLKNNEGVSTITWDHSGNKFIAAGKKQFALFPENFMDNDEVPTQYFTFSDQFPYHHYDALQEVCWNPSDQNILAWQNRGGRRGYVGDSKNNVLFVIDSQAWQVLRKIKIEPAVEWQGVINDTEILISRWGKLGRLNYHDEPFAITPEYYNAPVHMLRRALHINPQYLVIERKTSETEEILILYDRSSQKDFILPVKFNGLMQLSIDKKMIYGNDWDDDIVDITYLTEQCSLSPLLKHLDAKQ